MVPTSIENLVEQADQMGRVLDSPTSRAIQAMADSAVACHSHSATIRAIEAMADSALAHYLASPTSRAIQAMSNYFMVGAGDGLFDLPLPIARKGAPFPSLLQSLGDSLRADRSHSSDAWHAPSPRDYMPEFDDIIDRSLEKSGENQPESSRISRIFASVAITIDEARCRGQVAVLEVVPDRPVLDVATVTANLMDESTVQVQIETNSGERHIFFPHPKSLAVHVAALNPQPAEATKRTIGFQSNEHQGSGG